VSADEGLAVDVAVEVDVVVAGVGETGPVPCDPRSIPEMVLAAVEGALADARLTYDDVDAVVTASVDLYDGLTAANVAVTEVVGAVLKPETRIAADGLAALLHALCQIKGGAYRTVLVVAHGKASMSSHDALTAWAMDPIFLQPLGVDFLVCAALEAQLAAERDRDATARWAALAATRARAAGRHVDVADVLASPVLASPITALMRAPLADGACAVVLRAGDGEGEGGGGVRVTVTGVGHDLSPHALGDRPLGAWAGLERACARACAMAGIRRGEHAFDLVEPCCAFAHEEELFVRAADVGPRALRSPSGGLYAGAVPVAAGLSRFAAAARWLRAAGSGRALAHGAWGPAAQGHVVAVLEASS
jgi:acetyl-CoA C-acetyltransferase